MSTTMYADEDDEQVTYLMTRHHEQMKPRSEQKYEDRHELDLLELLEQDDFYQGDADDQYDS